jgi:PleD family two-component response regulator
MNSPAEKYKILIVDDMPINLQVLSDFLKSDYHIKVATTGVKTIEIAVSPNPPDIILLDIIMPEMDGLEICRLLKNNPETADIPVIFITAKGAAEDETQGLELGAADYISKPFHPIVVKARIKTQLELKEYRYRLEKMNRELQQTLKEAKSLRSVIPFCSGCRKIRNPDADPEKQSSWMEIDDYVRRNAGEEPHELCPECSALSGPKS